MNRREGDPEGSDYTDVRNTLCLEHARRLHTIEEILTGNGGDQKVREQSVVWQLRLLLERQKPIFDFFNIFGKLIWLIVAICVGGAMSALWQGLRALIHKGLI